MFRTEVTFVKFYTTRHTVHCITQARPLATLAGLHD